MLTELEKLCGPVFQGLCNYWQASRVAGRDAEPVEREKFQRDITGLLAEAKEKAGRDPRLEQEFAWIEKPLVFFIDYMVKEGRFSFRGEWRELARNYNELSGDEKFFDLLTETLEYPDLENSLALFYIMLGLGFDGAYRYNREYIEQCMRRCVEKAHPVYDIFSNPLVSPPKKKPFFKRRKLFHVRVALIASAVFMAVCFIINLAVFSDVAKRYREVLRRTAADAAPQTMYTPADTSVQGDD